MIKRRYQHVILSESDQAVRLSAEIQILSNGSDPAVRDEREHRESSLSVLSHPSLASLKAVLSVGRGNFAVTLRSGVLTIYF